MKKKTPRFTRREIEAVIAVVGQDLKLRQEKYLRSCKRMALFCKEAPTLMGPIVNECRLLLRYAKALGVKPTESLRNKKVKTKGSIGTKE